MELTADQLVEMLEHDEDTDIWVLNEDGSTAILPDQDITPLQHPQTWPKYICRSSAVNSHVRDKGVDGALKYINWVIETTMLQSNSRKSAAFATSLVAALRTVSNRSAG